MSEDLWRVFEQTCNRMSGRDAIVQGDRSSRFSWWHHRAQAYAAWLIGHGLNRHDRVLLWMENSTEMAAALLGIWAARGIAAILDISSPAIHFRHALRSINPEVVVCFRHDTLPIDDCPVPVVSIDEIPHQPRLTHLPAPALSTDPASIVFTSGSTGPPKGVVQSHGNLIRACRTVGRYLRLTAKDRILCPVPWSFDYGYGQLLSTALLGAVQVLPTKIDPFAICKAIDEHQPTVLAGAPNLFTYFFRGVAPFRDLDLSPIGIVTNTGGKIPGAILDEMTGVFGHSRIFLNYGLTESYRTSYLDPELVRERPTSIGKPVPGVDVALVRDDGTLAEPDEEGEIVHRGDFLFLGYWNDPEATATALRPDPLAPSACPPAFPALFTGDYGHKDRDGFLYFHGRRDQMLKSMGMRVSAGEVEDLLHRSGVVREVAVFGVEHDLIGDEVWAAVVPADGVENAPTQLKNYARTVMSQNMTPRRYLVRPSLPRTHTGKVDYLRLKQEAGRSPSAMAAGGSQPDKFLRTEMFVQSGQQTDSGVGYV